MYYEDESLYDMDFPVDDEAQAIRDHEDEMAAYRADEKLREERRREIERRGDHFAVTHMGDAFRDALRKQYGVW
jgi:hypothetical protein